MTKSVSSKGSKKSASKQKPADSQVLVAANRTEYGQKVSPAKEFKEKSKSAKKVTSTQGSKTKNSSAKKVVVKTIPEVSAFQEEEVKPEEKNDLEQENSKNP